MAKPDTGEYVSGTNKNEENASGYFQCIAPGRPRLTFGMSALTGNVSSMEGLGVI